MVKNKLDKLHKNGKMCHTCLQSAGIYGTFCLSELSLIRRGNSYVLAFRQRFQREEKIRRDAIEGVLWDTHKYKIVIDKNEQMFYSINIRTFVP